MNEADRGGGVAESFPRLRVNRRAFVGGSLAVGGAVAAPGLLTSCERAGSDAGAEESAVVHLRINGQARQIAVDNRTSLLDLLRERAGLTGSKKGCDEDAFQCGYCTAGQIVSGVGCIREGHARSAAEIREWMSGNICRCGAYTNIAAAIAKTANEA